MEGPLTDSELVAPGLLLANCLAFQFGGPYLSYVLITFCATACCILGSHVYLNVGAHRAATCGSVDVPTAFEHDTVHQTTGLRHEHQATLTWQDREEAIAIPMQALRINRIRTAPNRPTAANRYHSSILAPSGNQSFENDQAFVSSA